MDAVTPRAQQAEILDQSARRLRMNHSERFEADAEAFYQSTGFLAPGKSMPAEMYGGESYEQRREEAWTRWTEQQREDLEAALQAGAVALRSSQGEAPQTTQEIVICAALQVGDLVVRGHRHDSCYHTAGLIPGLTRSQIRGGVQGFVTSRNRFVGREEAMQIQVAAGVKSAYSPDGQHRGSILFSEDLY